MVRQNLSESYGSVKPLSSAALCSDYSRIRFSLANLPKRTHCKSAPKEGSFGRASLVSLGNTVWNGRFLSTAQPMLKTRQLLFLNHRVMIFASGNYDQIYEKD